MHQATVENAGLFVAAWIEKRDQHGEDVVPDDMPFLVAAAIEAAEYEEKLARDAGEEPWVNHEALCQKGEDWFPPA
jgi:hypothetical protein